MKNGTPFFKWKERQPRPMSRVWFSSNTGTKPGLQSPFGGRVRPLRSVFALHRPVRRVSSCRKPISLALSFWMLPVAHPTFHASNGCFLEYL